MIEVTNIRYGCTLVKERINEENYNRFNSVCGQIGDQNQPRCCRWQLPNQIWLVALFYLTTFNVGKSAPGTSGKNPNRMEFNSLLAIHEIWPKSWNLEGLVRSKWLWSRTTNKWMTRVGKWSWQWQGSLKRNRVQNKNTSSFTHFHPCTSGTWSPKF